MISVDQADNGKMITIQCQSRIQLSLRENPTTGFRWQEEAGMGSMGVRLKSGSFLSGDGIGTGGIRQWIFLAGESGKSNIAFRYKRPWEKDSPADETFQLTVEVLP